MAANNYNEINLEVNRLAVEMVSYDPEDKKSEALVQTLRSRVLELLYTSYAKAIPVADPFDGTLSLRFYPLINSFVSADVLIDTAVELLTPNKNGQWRYKPEKSSFISAFINRIRYRNTSELEKKGKSRTMNGHQLFSLDETVGDADDATASRFEAIADPDAVGPEEMVIRKVVQFGLVLESLENLDIHFARVDQKAQKYYTGFFTYYTVDAVKTNDVLGQAACRHDSELFPRMAISLLEYLMTGTFERITDVIINPLRPGIFLNKRFETLAGYFQVARQTVIKYNDNYTALKDAVLGL